MARKTAPTSPPASSATRPVLARAVVVAEWTSASLLRLVPASALTDGLSADLDGRVLFFALALSLACGVLFGLIPALQGASSGLAATLKDNANSVGGGFVRFRKLLVSSQVALSLVLLIGAGLFARSLYNLKSLNPGFLPTSILEFSMQPSLSGYSTTKRANYTGACARKFPRCQAFWPFREPIPRSSPET